jgi:signal transduction histidine kinase
LREPLQEVRERVARLREELEDLPAWASAAASFEICDALCFELDRLEAVVRDFLASARPDVAPPRIVDAARLVREWALAIEPELAARDVAIVAEGTEIPAVAIADPGGLKQVFWNLVRNARDAAPRGSIVRVSVERDSERVRIRVADRGPGISRARREEVFEPLVSTKREGLGLGLAVARHLAEAMGATISVGGGTCGAVLEVALRRAPPAARFLGRAPARARSR